MHALRRVVSTGIIAGLVGAFTIDTYILITVPLMYRSVTPEIIMQSDAANALGAAAYHGGAYAVVLGTAMHVCVSLCWGILFALLAWRFSALVRMPILAGTIYGAIVMFLMWEVVVPLGRAPAAFRPLPHVVNLAVAHVLFFGVPVALVTARRFEGSARAKAPG